MFLIIGHLKIFTALPLFNMLLKQALVKGLYHQCYSFKIFSNPGTWKSFHREYYYDNILYNKI